MCIKNDYATANVALETSKLFKTVKFDNKALAKALDQNDAKHICTMKELQAEIARSKESD